MTSHVVKEKYPWVAVRLCMNTQSGSALHPNEPLTQYRLAWITTTVEIVHLASKGDT